MWQEALYIGATLLLGYIVRLLFLAHKGNGGPLYWWRWVWLVVEVWVKKATRQPKMNNFDLYSKSYDLCGITATPTERELEQPKPLITDRHVDEMLLCGVDREGRAVVAKIGRLTQRRASVFLCVVDHTGTVYTLPNQPDTSQFNVCDEGWRGAGLSLTCVDPMRLWRLKFNGLLRRGARLEYVTEDDDQDDIDGVVVHGRLDLLWKAVRHPVNVWDETNPRLLAQALARHPDTPSLSAFLCGEEEWYQQWGSLHGTVTLAPGAADPQVWYLRGPRQHRWGLSQAVGRAMVSFVYFNSGDLCSLHGHTTSSTTQYVGGYVQQASGNLRCVTSIDLDIGKLDHLATLGNNLFIKFTAGWQTYEVWQHLREGVLYYSGDPWTTRHLVHPTTVAASHSYGWGLTFLSDRYEELCPVPERESIREASVPRVVVEDEGTPLVVALDDPLCRNPLLTGGKGASLALLTAYAHLTQSHQGHYVVPSGMVVTVAAWHLQLQSFPDLQLAIKAVRQAVGTTQPGQIKEACTRAVEVCQGLEVCPQVANAVQEALRQHLDSQSSRLAVRSSGCGEDSEEASAAGQNDTILGVSGLHGTLRALTRCWASMYTYHSVEYRRQRGQAVEVGMGVVVQEMVDAEAAGVMFTLDPVTGSPANITITANYGLGESVVSAAAEPDTVVVRRSWRDHLTVASKSLGTKKMKCIMKENEGTEEVEVGEEERTRQCLSDAIALRLARLAIFLNQAFASPRDVEFALAQDTVYMLQARPITTLETWTDYELIHEQDTALLTDHEILTKSNIAEVIPGSLTQLTMTLLTVCLELSFMRERLRLKWPSYVPDPCFMHLGAIYGSQYFLNLLEVQYQYGSEKVKFEHRILDLGIHGHFISKDQYVQWGLERFGVPRLLSLLMMMNVMIYDILQAKRIVRRGSQKFADYDLACSWAVSATSLHREITRRFTDLIEVTWMHHCISKLSSITQSFLLTGLAQGNEELSEENFSDLALLLSSCEGVESADVPTALEEMARVIAENEEVEDFLGMTSDEGQVWLESHPGTVGVTFRSFLTKHGHRCLKEFDLSSVSWGLDPRTLIPVLQVMVRHPASFRSRREKMSVDQILDQLQTPVSSSTRRFLRFLLPKSREAIVNREATKSLGIKVIDGFRRAYRKLGQLLVSEGRLPSLDLVFFLTHNELGHLVHHPSPPLIAKAVRRQRLFPGLNEVKFPEISIGVPCPLTPRKQSEREMMGSGEVIVATPVCNGVVTAPARVVTCLQDASSIQNGDILVTHSTDVGWTPYFPLLAGVITEIGGLISHGAVVAREYGLPCVVGAADATSVIQSGETIVLNATQGTVTCCITPQPPNIDHNSNFDSTSKDQDSSCKNL